MKLEINIKDIVSRPALKLIELKGELDISGSKELAQEVLPVIQGGHCCLIADLRNLEYINSTGIYGLMCCFNKAKEKGGFLKLVAVNERVKEILEVVGMLKLLNFYDTLDEALMDTK